ncbi:MAG: winged helix-turn-helix transcriptional regulator [Candidatus Lokiarchaeota archaeon]|nr:winged helix-turn-helix transcriptional regulator [Candidatus Harpocratesius repetitus]
MKNSHHRLKTIRNVIILLFVLSIVINIMISPVNSQGPPDTPGKFNGNQEHGPQTSKKYKFGDNLSFELISKNGVNFSISYDENLADRMLGMEINNTENITLQIEYLRSFDHPIDKKIKRGYDFDLFESFSFMSDSYYSLNSNFLITNNEKENEDNEILIDSNFDLETYFTITLEPDKIESIEIYTLLNYSQSYSSSDSDQYLWVYYDSKSNEWISLNTEIIENGVSFVLDSDSIPDEFTITVVKIRNDSSIFPLQENLLFYFILGIIVVAIIFGILMSSQEYRQFLLNRVLHIDKGAHRLSMEDVLENKNRNQIIDMVLSSPGIHFNELLRKTGLSAGNLAWHLDILETFKVIRKQRIGQYLVYYPYHERNPISKLDPLLQKSRTTLEILQMINDHPGIFQKQIAHRMDLDHKTVKYHIDKLFDAKIIVSEKIGRKKLYYPADHVNE